LADVPPGPTLLVANEFFDALPVRQFVRAGGAWRERMVGLRDDRLAFGLGPAGATDAPADAPEGAVWEVCPAGRAAAQEIGARLAAHGGAALAIDYGASPGGAAGGDTLQAVRDHRFVDPLQAPGAADLTAHVDFDALAAALAAGGATVWPLATQGALLTALGLEARAAALSRASPDRAADVEVARQRLSDPGAMGALFKALAATGPDQPPPPGFAPALAPAAAAPSPDRGSQP
jgi:SAM-dependent MidA family methyltransferase